MKYPSKREEDFKTSEAEFASAKERGLQMIYNFYPQIPRNQANDLAIQELTNAFLDDGGLAFAAPTLSTWRSIVEADPTILTGQHGRLIIEPVEKQKLRVLGEIEELLSNWHPHDLKTELMKLRFKPLAEVQARKQQVLEERRLRQMSVSGIKVELQAARPKPQVKVLPPEITKEKIHSMSSGEIRKLIRDFTASVVNDRIFGRS